jgi:hypothetical protein
MTFTIIPIKCKMGGVVKYGKSNLILLGWVLKFQQMVYENVSII